MPRIPIVVCGRNPNIAKNVRKGLEPEYDVIHIILSPEQGVEGVPILLAGSKPTDTAENLGSQDYTKPPVAIIFGGGFDEESYNKVRSAPKDDSSVMWLRTDMSRMSEMPKAEEFGDTKTVEAYAAAVAKRASFRLGELKAGHEDGTKSGVYFF